MSMKINDIVTWVGKNDWELKKFHGDEYSTYKGTSYNSYLIKDEKNVLIDTVWLPFSDEYVRKLKKEIDLKEIDYIISNHAEIDHSGALSMLMEEIPDTPIYCTKKGVEIIKGHHHKDWNFKVVKTGDELDIGKNKIRFIEAPMLHWPDSMFSYLTEEKILFSNDAFGQHLSSEFLYNDLVDQADLMQEAMKYYANILMPFSPLVAKKIKELKAMDITIDMICTSHGVIWRNNPIQIIEKYQDWSNNYQENQITIIYDSMWNGTRRMAEAIAEGINNTDQKVVVKILHSAKSDKNDIVTEVFKSKAIVIGSSTINNGILTSTAAILEIIKGMKFKNKNAASFGSYGWSGESIKIINEELDKAGFNRVVEGIKELWNPDTEALERCRKFGEELICKIKNQ